MAFATTLRCGLYVAVSPLVLFLLASAQPVGTKKVRHVPLDSADTDELSLLQHGSRVLSPAAAARGRDAKSDQGPRSHRNAAVPTVVVDLDVAPELRWRNVTQYWKDLGVYPDCCTVGPEMAGYKPLLASVPLDDEYRREMEGIVADVGHPDLTVEALILQSIGYEMTGSLENPLKVLQTAAEMILRDGVSATPPEDRIEAVARTAKLATASAPRRKSQGCSAVLAAMPDGTVVHGRNMDYDGFEVDVNGTTLHWPEVTIEVLFMKGGKPFISSVHWPGQIGIHTAMRFGGWSFEQNTRFHGVVTDQVYGLLRHSEGFMLRSRRIMETTPDFESALQQMYNTNLMAPQYFIMAGPEPYQGAVLTMDRGAEHLQSQGTPPLLRLGKVSGGRSGLGWSIVQTNDDHLHEPLDDRRPREQLRLSTAKQDMVSADWMWNEMLGPALYSESTVFTSVYVPATGFHETLAHPEHTR